MSEPVKRDSVLETVQQAAIDDPHSPVGVFQLPCGWIDGAGALHKEVQVQEITGHEEDMLASRNIPDWRKTSLLLGACLTRVGNVSDRKAMSTIPRSLLIGDRAFLMFAIRRVSLGNAYPYRETCPGCQYAGIFTLDLSDLDIRQMPDPLKRVYHVKLPSGRPAVYRHLCGADEESMAKAKNVDEVMSMQLLLRLQQLSGAPASLPAVKSLGLRDRNFLRDEFARTDGGVDTSLEMECPRCLREFEKDLEVGQKGFFFPSSAAKTSKDSSSG